MLEIEVRTAFGTGRRWRVCDGRGLIDRRDQGDLDDI